MPKCAKCGANAAKVNKANLCDSCRIKAEKAVKDAAQKVAMDKKAAADKDARIAMAKAAEAKQKFNDEKKAKVNEIAATWRGQINVVFNQVITLRANHPAQAATINAGNNPAGNTPGGTNNPLVLAVPSNNYKIEKIDVFNVMKPDNSDSGLFKFRKANGAKDIMVHVK